MKAKWITFLLTFLSYGLLHAVRRSLSSLKYALNSPPFVFSTLFLGVLDMLVLITLATSLVILGPKIINHGPVRLLQFSMVCLSIVLGVLAFIVIFTITSGFPYIVIYSLVGLCLCVGWPSCIYVLSLQFQKGIAFSLWFGCTQFGDVIAVLLNLIFIQALDVNAGFFLFVIICFIYISFILNRKYLQKYALQSEAQSEPQPEKSPAQGYIQDLVEEKEIQPASNQKMSQERKEPVEKKIPSQQSLSRINFLTVWTLPGVPGYILSFIFVKCVNVMISGWLVFYLNMIGMLKESNIIVLLWSISTFGGGILGVYLNRKFTKKYFIIALLISAVFFIFLEEMHLYPDQTEVIVLVLACGIAFGGPYTLMNTSIPLYLSQKPHIKNHPDAKAAIISAMEGYSLLFCGVSLIIIPAIGVVDLHWFAFFYCLTAALILLRQEFIDQKEALENQVLSKQIANQVKVRESKDLDRQLSANLQGANYGKKQRRRRRSMKSQRSIEGERSYEKDSDKYLNQNKSISGDKSEKKQKKLSLPSLRAAQQIERVNDINAQFQKQEYVEEKTNQIDKQIDKQAEIDPTQPFCMPIQAEKQTQAQQISENNDYFSVS